MQDHYAFGQYDYRLVANYCCCLNCMIPLVLRTFLGPYNTKYELTSAIFEVVDSILVMILIFLNFLDRLGRGKSKDLYQTAPLGAKADQVYTIFHSFCVN